MIPWSLPAAAVFIAATILLVVSNGTHQMCAPLYLTAGLFAIAAAIEGRKP